MLPHDRRVPSKHIASSNAANGLACSGEKAVSNAGRAKPSPPHTAAGRSPRKGSPAKERESRTNARDGNGLPQASAPFLTPARGPVATAPVARHMRAMLGSPLKRQRKLGIRTEDGRVIPFPYMPRVADLPPGWRYFTTAEKIEHLIGLDRCDEILS